EPGVLIKYLPGVPLSFDVNFNVVFQKVLTTGVSYRNRESVDFLAIARMTPQLQVGYSYDYPIGEIRRISNGSHEVMVSYLFRFARSGVTSPR
ncbi:MAG: type IX secretion system membrane protein PorP/SprF, partial [Bacteroidota bacterium]|nr:type IX secretion system membrane protein PorP/SprF [Bacteroidota bacterium]